MLLYYIPEKHKLVIGDSIPKSIHPDAIKDTELSIHRGADFQRLTNKISNNSKTVNVKGFKYILVHLGTNSVASLVHHNNMRLQEIRATGFPDRPLLGPAHIFTDFKCLIHKIWEVNPDCTIIFSAILPRPCDHQITYDIVKEVNALIRDHCLESSDSAKLIYNPTFLRFQHALQPKTDCYNMRDGLHLSKKGVEELTQAFQIALSDKNLQCRSHCFRGPKSRKRKR